MKLREHITILVLVLTSGAVCAQGFYNRNTWKRYRSELSFGAGVANFLGDLGGRDMVGSDFLWDLEISETKFASNITYMYYLARNIGWRQSFSFGKVSGDDALTNEIFRNNRNLNFESNIFEYSSNFEIQLKKEIVGNRYNLKSPAGKKLGLGSLNMGFYGVLGVGFFYYNPMARSASGAKIALRPLKTEGQGLPGGPEEYGKFAVNVPLGLGVRRSINREWGFKIELTHRFTFTDYIDDVSTVYYDKQLLNEHVGGDAVYFQTLV